ncbi:MAG: dockerin type I repeat-containing protein [Oscillospiraceae bacterium]
MKKVLSWVMMLSIISCIAPNIINAETIGTSSSDIILYGDVNLDGFINDDDLSLMKNYLIDKVDLDEVQEKNADIYQSDNYTNITLEDYVMLKQYLNSEIEYKHLGQKLNSNELDIKYVPDININDGTCSINISLENATEDTYFSSAMAKFYYDNIKFVDYKCDENIQVDCYLDGNGTGYIFIDNNGTMDTSINITLNFKLDFLGGNCYFDINNFNYVRSNESNLCMDTFSSGNICFKVNVPKVSLMMMLKRYMLGLTEEDYIQCVDFNNDGKDNILDLTFLKNNFLYSE